MSRDATRRVDRYGSRRVAVPAARVDEALRHRDVRATVAASVFAPIDRVEEVEVVGAVDGGARADATRIPRHDVEAIAHRSAEDVVGVPARGRFPTRRVRRDS